MRYDIIKHSSLLSDLILLESLLVTCITDRLQLAADYSPCDPTRLDRFLVSVNPQLSLYTYRMLENGIDRNMLPNLTDEILEKLCEITNPVHRIRLMQALQGQLI